MYSKNLAEFYYDLYSVEMSDIYVCLELFIGGLFIDGIQLLVGTYQVSVPDSVW